MTNPPASTRQIQSHVVAEWFVNSVTVLLLAFAVMLFWCNHDNWNLTPPQDPIIGVSLRTLFFVAGGVCLAVSILCLGVRSHSLRVLCVAWLAINVQVYQAGLYYYGSQAMHSCFGYVSAAFGLSAQVLGMLAQIAFLYLLVGSVSIMVWFWLESKGAGMLARQVASGEMLKVFCPACGGHIIFSAANIGQQIPCPHCQASMALRRPDNLKMSCYFCKGHLEFPAHALGTKIPCPHCKKDISLVEQKS